MSKLVTRLENLSKETGEPIGFKATVQRHKGIPMLFMAALPKIDAHLAQKLGSAADVILVPVNDLEKDLTALKSLAQAAKELTWGVRFKGNGSIADLQELGADFVVFEPENTPASVLQMEEMGKVAEVLPSLSEGLISSLEEMSIDAVLMSSSANIISVHQIMTFRWIADLVCKPLLVVLSGDLSSDDLSNLWDAGVQGVVIPVKVAADKDKLLELRKALSDKPVKRNNSKISPILPHLGSSSSSFDDDDDDEDD
jgi:hypothetical protein